MNAREQQARRIELYKKTNAQLVQRYCEVSGHLPREVLMDQKRGLYDVRALVDLIVYAEAHGI